MSLIPCASCGLGGEQVGSMVHLVERGCAGVCQHVVGTAHIPPVLGYRVGTHFIWCCESLHKCCTELKPQRLCSDVYLIRLFDMLASMH